MQMNIKELLTKYRDGKISESEMALLETWYLKWTPESEEINIEKLDQLEEEVYAKLPTPVKRVKLWPRIAAAAAIILIISVGLLYFGKQNDKQIHSPVYANDLDPGSTGATLTLANGKKIKLGTATNGELAKESGVTITKTADGQILYEVKDPAHSEPGQINTLSTAKGETYRVRLPDQSEVWLNAASVIKYPASFTMAKERRVELEGEAYFQIAKDKNHPFIVKTDKQEVKVLGTHFNIKAYIDEPLTKTTLVEGSVQISNQFSSKTLKPGQQAILLQKGNFEIGPSDEVLDLAWKNNEFMFESESIENVMKMVERWYNVEVIYIGEKSSEKFGGGVSRFDKVSKVLELLERTGAVKFRIENRKIYVMKSAE